MAKIFEYKEETFYGDEDGHIDWLNSQGLNGWEIVTKNPHYRIPNQATYLFKREK